MIKKATDNLVWFPGYLGGVWRNRLQSHSVAPKHVYFCICDHFEPYWGKADGKTARERLRRWIDEYPKVADRHRDSGGAKLTYTFFYPEEEYRKEDLDALAELCRSGYGEVEIHLHHDNDTANNLRRTLLDYKRRLHEVHGLLSTDSNTGEIRYGFIHGNWALDNSRPDGRWCGVNNEIEILQETGCYADFTMPSAPDSTQTGKINSVYYAVDDPGRPKSHDKGADACVGRAGEGLLMVQGPLTLSWHNRKWGVLPRIENGALQSGAPVTPERVRSWIAAGIHVKGAADHVFVKLYTHGTQERNMRMLFDEGGLARLLSLAREETERSGAEAHFVSARELASRIHEIEGTGQALPVKPVCRQETS